MGGGEGFGLKTYIDCWGCCKCINVYRLSDNTAEREYQSAHFPALGNIKCSPPPPREYQVLTSSPSGISSALLPEAYQGLGNTVSSTHIPKKYLSVQQNIKYSPPQGSIEYSPPRGNIKYLPSLGEYQVLIHQGNIKYSPFKGNINIHSQEKYQVLISPKVFTSLGKQ